MHAQRVCLPAISISLVLAAVAGATPDLNDGTGNEHVPEATLVRPDPSAPLAARDAVTGNVVTTGPFTVILKNLAVVGRGERNVAEVTTDVWAHRSHAYIGTFNDPCGTGAGAGTGPVMLVDDIGGPGIPVFNVRNPVRPVYLGNIPSVAGSRINDIKVAAMNSGDILVHSNEPCAGGPGGFEIYDVRNPSSPVHLASVQTDDSNEVLRDAFGVVDVGVHNLFLFSQGQRDYVAAVTEGFFGNFQVFDISDPTSPYLVTAWGAEELCTLSQCSIDPQNETDPDVILDTIFDWLFEGFGVSRNRFLHDITVNAAGTRAYLSNWDAGLVLLDISDVADPLVVSVALDPAGGSLDGEVNSHAAWPSEDGRIVVETEEDFDAWEASAPPGNLTFGEDAPPAPLPGVAISTSAGNDFEDNQTGNAGSLNAMSLQVSSGPLAGNSYPAIELSGNQPKLADVGPVMGDTVWIGRACDGDPILNDGAIAGGGIAVVRRGACTFREKNFNAAAAGASAIAIANNIELSTPWGGVRIWDYSDPANPVLASTFNTACSASTEPMPGCDPDGTYSVHNVIVETTGNRVKAYFSWYSDGMLILDVTDPYNPVEIARYLDTTGPNDGLANDFWGVYKTPRQPWIYGSDRNGGLYIFKELGIGTDMQ